MVFQTYELYGLDLCKHEIRFTDGHITGFADLYRKTLENLYLCKISIDDKESQIYYGEYHADKGILIFQTGAFCTKRIAIDIVNSDPARHVSFAKIIDITENTAFSRF